MDPVPGRPPATTGVPGIAGKATSDLLSREPHCHFLHKLFARAVRETEHTPLVERQGLAVEILGALDFDQHRVAGLLRVALLFRLH
jgi:hypothetical protein